MTSRFSASCASPWNVSLLTYDSSSSSLDLIFASQTGLVRGVRIIKPPAATNDHHGIRFSLEIMTPKLTVKPRKIWKVDDEGARKFRQRPSSIDWNGFFDLQCNSDVAVGSFQELFLAAAKDCFQLKSVGSKRLLRPSLSATTGESLRKSRGAFHKWRRTKDPKDLDAWKEMETRCKKMIHADRYRKLRIVAGSSRRNPRAVWQYVKKNTVSSPIPPIPIPGSVDRYLVHAQDKAVHISDVSVKEYVECPVHCKESQTPSACRLTSPSTVHCPELHISTSTILSNIRKLDANKAAGSSLITDRLFKIAGTSIIYPLSRLFNLILQSGKFPTSGKMADVVVVPKKGGSAFRPISLLPPLSKLFEKILSEHLSSFFISNKLLSDSQYGFRHYRSTEM
ncbi:hypothetical protein RvY_16615 [Ramazzottius varieornatus]|uniref:Uncharacterized protein n=1 Tax=Ramazzottius varieornatus TaxID=947166 RepID=A0A1D1W1U2_RAMVA|nr:hypothetical protein RvY_16615 [Ramazzottius varieornatus]